jgi:hypothetical protein
MLRHYSLSDRERKRDYWLPWPNKMFPSFFNCSHFCGRSPISPCRWSKKSVVLVSVARDGPKIPHAILSDRHLCGCGKDRQLQNEKNQPACNNHKPAIKRSDPPASARTACRDAVAIVLVQQRQAKSSCLRRSASVAAAESTAAPQRRVPVYSQHHRIHAGSPRCQFPVLHEMASQVLYLALHCVLSARCLRWHGCQAIQSKYLRPLLRPFYQCLS